MLGLYYMPTLCYIQCCYEIYGLSYTYNNLLNALLECIKFTCIYTLYFLLTYLNSFMHLTYSQLCINCVLSFWLQKNWTCWSIHTYIISHALSTPKATFNKYRLLFESEVLRCFRNLRNVT